MNALMATAEKGLRRYRLIRVGVERLLRNIDRERGLEP